MWPEGLPEHPAKALQVVVSRARAQLGADVIASTPTGYRLSLAEEQVDTSAVLLRAAASAARPAPATTRRWPRPRPAWRCLRGPGRRRRRAGTSGGPAGGAGAGLPGAGPGPRPGPVAAGPPHRGGRGAGRTARRQWDEEVMAELLRCEAATLGPSAALAQYRGVPPGAADELRHRPRPRPPGAAAAAAGRHRAAGPPRRAPRAQPAAGPRRRHRRPGDLLRSSRVTSIVGPGGLGKTRLAHAVSRRATQRSSRSSPWPGSAPTPTWPARSRRPWRG